MIESEFKTVMFCGKYVNVERLHEGIYTSSKPSIYSIHETIDSLCERGHKVNIAVGGINGTGFIPSSYFVNLKRCVLADILISVKTN